MPPRLPLWQPGLTNYTNIYVIFRKGAATFSASYALITFTKRLHDGKRLKFITLEINYEDFSKTYVKPPEGEFRRWITTVTFVEKACNLNN